MNINIMKFQKFWNGDSQLLYLKQTKGFCSSNVQNLEMDGKVIYVIKFKPRDLVGYNDKIALPLVVHTWAAV